MYALILNQEGRLRIYYLPNMVTLVTAFLPNLSFTYSILTLSPKMGLSKPNGCGGKESLGDYQSEAEGKTGKRNLI
jgi:hypothetical protein